MIIKMIMPMLFLLFAVLLIQPLQSAAHDANQCDPTLRVTDNLGNQQRVYACPEADFASFLMGLILALIAISALIAFFDLVIL